MHDTGYYDIPASNEGFAVARKAPRLLEPQAMLVAFPRALRDELASYCCLGQKKGGWEYISMFVKVRNIRSFWSILVYFRI